MTFKIRPVTDDLSDLEILTKFCSKLAQHDGHEINFDAGKIKEQISRQPDLIHAAFAEVDDQPIGFIFMHIAFSIYYGEAGLYLNGLFIEENHRGKGYGGALLSYIAKYAQKNHYNYVFWLTENNNKNALEYYEKIGADRYSNWSFMRLGEQALLDLKEKGRSEDQPMK